MSSTRNWNTMRPCPFCADPAPVVTRLHTDTIFAARCVVCSAYGPTAPTEEEAMDKWDKRGKRGMEGVA